MGKILFQKGNKAAENKRGKKHKSTLLKEKLGVNNIGDLREDSLKVFKEMLNDKDKLKRFLAAKEIARYIFAQKRENTIEEKRPIKVVFHNIGKE